MLQVETQSVSGKESSEITLITKSTELFSKKIFSLSQHQNRVDRNSVYSGIAGAVATGIAGVGPATGFFLGVAGGCIGTGIYNSLDEKNKS